MEPTTNGDLMERLNALEEKVDAIYSKLDQAAGAWTFVKIISSVILGFVVLYNGMHSWFK